MLQFKGLKFDIQEGRIYLYNFYNFNGRTGAPFVEVQVCGENKDTHLGAIMVNSSEGERLKYISHNQTENRLEIVQASELVEVKTTFIAYLGTSSVQIYTEVKNISSQEIILEEASSFVGAFLGENSIEN